jgi:hypothetical protein
MGDAGEGWVDAEARVQERMEELERERGSEQRRVIHHPELQQALESLRLARTELERQLNTSAHATRKAQLTQAIEEIDRRIAATRAQMNP